MPRDRRFFAGLVGVAAVVSYLIYTGISDTMVYYLTPSELLTRIEENPDTMERGVKVNGMLVPGSYMQSTDELLHTFVVEDPNDASVRLTVEFPSPSSRHLQRLRRDGGRGGHAGALPCRRPLRGHRGPDEVRQPVRSHA